jgi:hypothetical protein
MQREVPAGTGFAAKFFWNTLPKVTGRFTILSSALSDGRYLLGWPKLAMYAPPLALLVGCMVGWSRSYSEETYTFSLFWTGLMLAISCFSAALGLWITVGYAGADFLLHGLQYVQGFDALLRAGSLGVSYVLLGMLLVLVPLVSEGLYKDTLRPIEGFLRRRSFGVSALLAIKLIVYPVIQAALVYAWTQNVPTLIRPIYTWRGMQPPVPAVSPLQNTGWVLVLLAVVMGMVRVILEFQPSESMQYRLAPRPANLKGSPSGATGQTSWVGMVWRAALTTVFLSGLLTSWWQAIFVTAAVAGTLVIRELMVTRLSGWSKAISHLPLLLRLAMASFASYVIASQVIRLMWNQTETFCQ